MYFHTFCFAFTPGRSASHSRHRLSLLGSPPDEVHGLKLCGSRPTTLTRRTLFYTSLCRMAEQGGSIILPCVYCITFYETIQLFFLCSLKNCTTVPTMDHRHRQIPILLLQATPKTATFSNILSLCMIPNSFTFVNIFFSTL